MSGFLASVEKRAFKQCVFAVRDDDTALDIVQDAMLKLAEKYSAKPAEELPLLFRWQKSLAGRVSFRFVSLDDDERQLRDFLGREGKDGLTSTYWLPDGALRQAWLDALKLSSEPELPLQLLIDPKGMLRCRVEGAIEPSDLAALQRITGG